MVATRKIRASEVLLEELPAASGPNTRGGLTCLQCQRTWPPPPPPKQQEEQQQQQQFKSEEKSTNGDVQEELKKETKDLKWPPLCPRCQFPICDSECE